MNSKESDMGETLSDRNVGEIVAEDYRTARVFERHGIDYCCGGKISIADACRMAGVKLDELAVELEAATAAEPDRSQDYAAWDLPFLTDYIVTVHHGYLHRNLGAITANAQKIAQVHGSHHPEVIEIAQLFTTLADELEAHLKEEEELFFPALKRLDAAGKAGHTPEPEDWETIRKFLRTLGAEHDQAGDAIHRIRALAANYRVPEDVCPTFRATYLTLNEFEEDLHKHVHLENNVLFPRAEKLIQAA